MAHRMELMGSCSHNDVHHMDGEEWGIRFTKPGELKARLKLMIEFGRILEYLIY